MSEFTMHDWTDEEIEKMFEGMKKYVRDTSTLKPCPFCGCKEVAYSKYISGTDVGGIECSGCGIIFVPTSESTAIEEWNRRASE